METKEKMQKISLIWWEYSSSICSCIKFMEYKANSPTHSSWHLSKMPSELVTWNKKRPILTLSSLLILSTFLFFSSTSTTIESYLISSSSFLSLSLISPHLPLLGLSVRHVLNRQAARIKWRTERIESSLCWKTGSKHMSIAFFLLLYLQAVCFVHVFFSLFPLL